jgi:uncharacterized protein involved in exopolysaccharide biosynthesis
VSTPPADLQPIAAPSVDDEGPGLIDLLVPLAQHWRLLLAAPVALGALALGATYLITPTFTSRTVFLPPQQQQSAAASALAALGPLAGLAGGVNIKTAGDQYVALMQSVNVEDRLVDQFKLMAVYESKFRFQARKTLEQNTRIALGKKDGLISVEVDAQDPQLAADIANQYVSELRRLSSELALTEAQQRRVFFEGELKRARAKLGEAQARLQGGGFNAGALKAEPKAAAETFARLKAEVTSAEVRLQTMRRTLADTSAEVQQQLTLLGALRGQLTRVEGESNPATNSADYLGRYREFKYQEALFELFSKQYELARLDESREGALIQIVDVATPAEHKSKPKRAQIAIGATAGSFILLCVAVLARHFVRRARETSDGAARFAQLGQAWRGR